MAQRRCLVSLALLVAHVSASAVSTSVFPNSACAGAASSRSAFVGIGHVVLSNGDLETHCGCPSDNLPSFQACPSSATGESVCHSVLDLETGAFTAECAIVACAGSECPTTVVNTVVVDEADCLYHGQGLIGFNSGADGQNRCACSTATNDSGEADNFTTCPSPANGRGTCVSVDPDFLGQSLDHREVIKCGVLCDEDYFLTPGGSCTKLAKRQVFPAGPSGAFHAVSQIKIGPSATGTSAASTQSIHHRSSTHHRHHTSVQTRHHASTAVPPFATSNPIRVVPGTGASQRHHRSTSSSQSNLVLPTGPIRVVPTVPTDSPSAPTGTVTTPRRGPSAAFSPTGAIRIAPGPSQRARMMARGTEQGNNEWVVEMDACDVGERSCRVGGFGNYSCIRKDDPTSCGGCDSEGSAVNCLESVGVATAACLRDACVIRSCLPGYSQSSEGVCSPKPTF